MTTLDLRLRTIFNFRNLNIPSCCCFLFLLYYMGGSPESAERCGEQVTDSNHVSTRV